jgi:GT2 family glycosyltransferase
MENKKEKIAAVVVTYNRKELLKECLNALLSQTYPLDSIILIDNASTDGTSEFLKENGYLDNPKIDYIRLPENTGSSGGFYEGVKRGYEKGHDWLWLMDDDSEPRENALENLCKYFNREDLSVLAGVVIDKKQNISLLHRGIIDFKIIFPHIQKPLLIENYKSRCVDIDFSSFVGIMVSRKAIEKVGYPNKKFFVYHDDVEYCIRLRRIGKILLITDSIITHKEQFRTDKIKKFFLGRSSMRTLYEKFWLTYYGIRNLTWLGKQYSENKLLFYFQMIKSMIRPIVGIILFDDHKLKRIKLILNAYIAGLKGDFDNNKPKKILYDN